MTIEVREEIGRALLEGARQRGKTVDELLEPLVRDLADDPLARAGEPMSADEFHEWAVAMTVRYNIAPLPDAAFTREGMYGEDL